MYCWAKFNVALLIAPDEDSNVQCLITSPEQWGEKAAAQAMLHQPAASRVFVMSNVTTSAVKRFIGFTMTAYKGLLLVESAY